MKRDKHVKSAEFSYGSSQASIDIVLPRLSWPLLLFENSIEYGSRVLSEIELETVISILTKDKEAMLKQRDFSLVYNEMLSDLIEVQTGRYGVKKGKEKTNIEGITSKIDEDALSLLCEMYDEVKGVYPEHPYEGAALYRFFRELYAEETETKSGFVKYIEENGTSGTLREMFYNYFIAHLGKLSEDDRTCEEEIKEGMRLFFFLKRRK